MRTAAILSVAGLITLAIAAALWGDDPAERAQAERIALLVQQLGSDEFAQREAAAKELEAMGEPPLAELRKAATGAENAEVRWRAQLLLAAPSRKSITTGLELLLIKAGEFQMGSTANEGNRHADETLHKVRISRPFYLGKFEVTQAEYRAVMKTSPSWFAESGGGQAKVAGLDTTRYPVERVSWFDAAAFCNELSRLDGFRPYYKLTNVEPVGESIKYAKVAVLGGYGYRLPSEAEWEFACRAGTATAYHYGGPTNGARANLKGVTSMGGYGGVVVGPNLQRTTVVGSYDANAFGLCDMHANVGEWCQDWYDKDYYANSPAVDPPGPDAGERRTWRGGSWLLNESSCRSATRAWHTSDERKDYLGFRIARNP